MSILNINDYDTHLWAAEPGFTAPEPSEPTDEERDEESLFATCPEEEETP